MIVQCPHCLKPMTVPDSATKEDVEAIISGQMGDFCSRFPALCGQVSSLEKKVNSIQEATTQHPIPTANLVDLWNSCPDCKLKLDQLIAEGRFKAPEPEEELPFAFMEHHD